MMLWYSSSMCESTVCSPYSLLPLLRRREPRERHLLQPLAQRVELDGLEHLRREGVRQERPRVLRPDPPTLHVEQRELVEPPHRRAVRALHIVRRWGGSTSSRCSDRKSTR